MVSPHYYVAMEGVWVLSRVEYSDLGIVYTLSVVYMYMYDNNENLMSAHTNSPLICLRMW